MAKNKRFWLRILSVRGEESWLVKHLFLLQFLQGAGIAFFFTASFALFLDRFEIIELPYVLVISAFLLWIAGFFYAKIEKKLSGINLALVVTAFMAASILLFRVAFPVVKNDYFLYAMLAWFNVLYLLNNLEFWGVASILFNVRQSKRLFSVISSGDIPAKFIGYTLALFIVEVIGTINLLWVGLGCMLLSIPILIKIKRSGRVPNIDHVVHHAAPHGGFRKFIHNFTGNTLTRSLAVLTILITSSYLIINFAFYAGVKSAYHNDVALAQFIALFLAIVRILAMVIKMIFTSRLINKLGIIPSLLITPIAMLVMITVIVGTQNMAGYQKNILYLFGATSIIIDILRSAINSPVFLTIMQPMPAHERLRAHTIVKGIMDPFASLFTGLALLGVIYLRKEVDLLVLSYGLLALSVSWIIGVYMVNRQYLRTVIKTISGKFFKSDRFIIDDENTITWLKEKLAGGTENEAINILNMIYRANEENKMDMVTQAIRHPSVKVKILALNLVEQFNIKADKEIITGLIHQQDPELVSAAIRASSKLGFAGEEIFDYAKHENPLIRQSALLGILKYGLAPDQLRLKEILKEMASSGDVESRRMAAEILAEESTGPDPQLLLKLMNDKEAAVRKSAYYAAARSEKPEMLQYLVEALPERENEILAPLYAAGEPALSAIHAAINAVGTTEWQREKLILICGRIGGNKSHIILLTLLETHPRLLPFILKALFRSNYVPKDKQQDAFFTLAKKMLAHSAGIVYMQGKLAEKGEDYELVVNSFQLELQQLRESLLFIFAILFNRENINRVRSAYESGRRDSILNAMEIIDITVRKDLAIHFNIIFEPGNSMDRMDTLRKIYPAGFLSNVEEVMEQVLSEEKRHYHNWTKACSLYISKLKHHQLNEIIISKCKTDESQMVRETAQLHTADDLVS